MVRFPTVFRDGEGVITQVLGKAGEPGVDTLSIINEFGLPGPFPEEAMENARQQASRFDESIGDDRIDLTDVPEEWISEFRSVVRQLDGRRAIELLETGPLPGDLASGMIGLIGGFYFDQVRDLIGMDSKGEM